eukprot:jgi/Ulvmu1/12313/UM088_0033.1
MSGCQLVLAIVDAPGPAVMQYIGKQLEEHTPEARRWKIILHSVSLTCEPGMMAIYVESIAKLRGEVDSGVQHRSNGGRSRRAETLYNAGSILLTMAVFAATMLRTHALVHAARRAAHRVSGAVTAVTARLSAATAVSWFGRPSGHSQVYPAEITGRPEDEREGCAASV